MLIRRKQQEVAKHREDGTPVYRERSAPVVLHCDIIKDQPFWADNPQILEPLA